MLKCANLNFQTKNESNNVENWKGSFWKVTITLMLEIITDLKIYYSSLIFKIIEKLKCSMGTNISQATLFETIQTVWNVFFFNIGSYITSWRHFMWLAGISAETGKLHWAARKWLLHCGSIWRDIIVNVLQGFENKNYFQKMCDMSLFRTKPFEEINYINFKMSLNVV